MGRLNQPALDEAARTLERELRLVDEGIALVASGTSTRVVIASLSLADQLLDRARAAAAAAGVRIVPIWSADESGPDLSIEGEDAADDGR